MSDQPTALRLASVLQNMGHKDVRLEAAGYELRRLYDVLGKSQALNRIREARIKELEAALTAEQDRCCRIVFSLCISDNNAQEIVDAIRGQE